MPCTQVDDLPAESKIWRYMDMPRFVDILRTESLYLASLPTMEDAWEGAVSAAGDVSPAVLSLQKTFGGPPSTALNFIAATEKHSAASRACVFINCWYRSEDESAAMWKLYEPTGRGIAIESTIGALTSAVTDDKESNLVAVKYVNFDEPEALDVFNLNRRYSYKRLSFSHENEVRLQHFDLMPSRPKTAAELAQNPPRSEWVAGMDYENVIDYGTLPLGKHLKMDIGRLVQRVVVAPEAPPWFLEVVRDVAAKYGAGFPVEPSSMLQRPRFGPY